MLLRQIKAACLCLAALTANTLVLKAQDKNIPKELYMASTLPDSLKQDANAVIRYDNTELTVNAPGRVVRKHHSLVTILNEKGNRYAQLVLGYSKKFQSIVSMQLLAYDANGKLIKKYNKSDAYDRSAIDGMSIITDSRIMALQHSLASYPSTIEISYETSADSYMDLQEWNIQPTETSVQQSTYKIVVNPQIGFRYKNKNTGLQPQKQSDGKNDVYIWQVKNLRTQTPEESIADWTVNPRIDFATDKFEYSGLPGDISNWKSYGQWQLALNNDVCSLSPQREQEIRQMTSGLKTEQEKARFLYNYVQQNMRYVSIQLGIGGLKPFAASFVDQKKYGDCKALSNYMYALLKAVGIRSHYALINAGINEEPADLKFPNDPFNHVILCIPFKNDTTWLECTSATKAYGKLGAFTENRCALLITEEGGKLVNTPKSSFADNQFNSLVQVKLDAEGGAVANVKIKSSGGYRDLFVDELPTISQDHQKEYLIRSLNFKQPSVFEVKMGTDSAGVKEVNFDLEYDTFAEVSAGSKKFYRPRVFDLWQLTLPALDKRRSDFYFEHPMQKNCTTVISLPEGFEAESVPENVTLKFSYGTYQASYTYNADKNEVTSKVTFQLDKQVIPAAKYAEMQHYMDDIARVQSKKLVVRRKA